MRDESTQPWRIERQQHEIKRLSEELAHARFAQAHPRSPWAAAVQVVGRAVLHPRDEEHASVGQASEPSEIQVLLDGLTLRDRWDAP